MEKNIQIRHVPDDVHRALKARAARLSMSLSDYLLSELEVIASRPTPVELMDRLASREPVAVSESPAEVIRRRRDA